MMQVKDLSLRLEGKRILTDVGFKLEPGQWLMLVGPNGAGKSSLLHALAQGRPYEGQILFEGRDLRRMKGRERAKCLALLSQLNEVGYAFSARELIRLGRYAYGGFIRGADQEDEQRILEAARMTGIEPILHQNVLTMSGGELQRVFLAQVLAQDPKLLLLDEPANHLDLQYQQQIFDLIAQWIQEPGRAVISVVHDLSLARLYGSHALLLSGGAVAAYGTMAEALDGDRLNEVYGMDVRAWMRGLLKGWEEHQ